jgi:spore coat polysaccharide biosynthesis protein SpsF
LRQCRLIDDILIATTTDPRDDAIADLCNREGWGCFRGSEQDVLDRYYQAARQRSAGTIIRITSDCPLIDPAVTDYVIAVIATYHAAAPAADYASNVFPRTYPRGLDTEVFSFAALETAWQEDRSERREHVTPFLWQQPERFRQINAANPVDFSSHRWTVDTPQDFELVRRIYDHFGSGDFAWRDVLALLDQHPDWVQLNADVEQKRV